MIVLALLFGWFVNCLSVFICKLLLCPQLSVYPRYNAHIWYAYSTCVVLPYDIGTNCRVTWVCDPRVLLWSHGVSQNSFLVFISQDTCPFQQPQCILRRLVGHSYITLHFVMFCILTEIPQSDLVQNTWCPVCGPMPLQPNFKVEFNWKAELIECTNFKPLGDKNSNNRKQSCFVVFFSLRYDQQKLNKILFKSAVECCFHFF